jgi:hypothetical protein
MDRSGSNWRQRRLAIAIAALSAMLLVWASSADAIPAERGYELVSPPDTGPFTPDAASLGGSDGWSCFETLLATKDGEGVIFTSGKPPEGGASNGIRELYEARRTALGWVTESKSATGAQSTSPRGGLCASPDHQFSTLLTGVAPFEQGTLGQNSSYVRTPSGQYVLAGAGSIGTDTKANIRWISSGGTHVVLTALKRLEPQAPTGIGSGTGAVLGELAVNAVYDRTPSGLRVVSLLPSGVAPSSATETTFYLATSADGSSVVFEVVKSNGSATLYERRGENPTVPIVTGAAAGDYRYAGISSDGKKVTYLKKGPASTAFPIRGSIYVFDATSQVSSPVTVGTEAAVVNVSDDGSSVYFTSEEAIPGTGQNGLGQSAVPSSPNLYLWEAETGEVRYVATVAPVDVEGDISAAENLTEWVRAVARPQQDPTVGRRNATSRTTPDGTVFVFQSRGNVTGYDSGGHAEIDRYDSLSGDLTCVSCPPEGDAAESDALLQRDTGGPLVAFNSLARLQNVTDDGRLVFFTTADALVEADENETIDVYEWEAGQVALVSSGRSSLPSLLYAMSADGRDVFFVTAEQLVPQDTSPVVSIYDARAGSSGFPLPGPPPPPPPVDPSVPPVEPSAGSEAVSGPADPKPKRAGARCKKRGAKKRCCPKKKRCSKKQGQRRGRRGR